MLDPHVLGALRQQLGANVLGELVRAFIGGLSEYRMELTEAVVAGDLGLAKRAAHKMKGASAQFGAIELTKIARAIEERATTIEEVAEVLPHMSSVIASMEECKLTVPDHR